MKSLQSFSTLAGCVLVLATTSNAATVRHCPSGANDICFSVGVPVSSANRGNGNIYFQITAPTSYSWVSLGTGNSMSGSNMFVMYQNGQGNVTVSPRLGTGHSTPMLDTSDHAAHLTLLSGSGVNGNTMTANVACANCEAWGNGGNMALTSNNAPWIAAWKRGSSLATASANARIVQHDDTTQYNIDLTQASIDNDSNPFVDSDSSNGDASNGDNNNDSDNDSDNDSGNGSGSGSGGNSGSGTGSGSGIVGVGARPSSSVLVAHAVILCIAMVFMYPIGSALMPLVGHWLVHGTWQGIAYLLMWAGFGLGIVAANQRHTLFSGEARTHTVLGTVVVAVFGLMPFLGYFHHLHYVRHQGRGIVSYVHIWVGRIFMVLAIVNGGLGLHLSGESTGAIAGYSVGAVVVFLTYVIAKTVSWFRKGSGRERRQEPRVGGGVILDGHSVRNKSRHQKKSDVAGNSQSDYPSSQPSMAEDIPMNSQPSQYQSQREHQRHGI